MDVVTFGESMVALNPATPGRLDTVVEFQRSVAGAESNVAIGLARLGHRVTWVSRLGADSFGRLIYKSLRGEGVDVTHVTIDAKHSTGVYFKEHSGDGRVNVYYYRTNSAASHLSAGDVPTSLLAEAKYLFVTGITPALSEGTRNAVYAALEQAHELGLQVVFDPNLRLKLWDLETAQPVLGKIAGLSDIVLPGLEEGRLLTGKTEPEAVAEEFLRGRTQLVVVKLGPDGAYYRTRTTEGRVAGFTVPLVDEVGAGDAFAAGLLSGLLDELPMQEAIRRACALGALAVTGVGDSESLPYREDLEQFLHGVRQPSR